MIKPHIFMMKMQKPVEKPGKYPGNHFNFGNIICHLKTLNIFIFWIRFVSQQISYYIEMVKPETGKKPVKTGENGSKPKPLYRQTGKTRVSSLPMKFTLIEKKVSFRL